MYKLNCILASSVNNVCRQLVTSLNTSGSSLCGSVRLRSLCTSDVGLQETEPSSTDSENFSYLPPMPGQDSPLRWDGKKFEELPIAHIKASYNNTIIHLTESSGQPMVKTSGGTEGFKNIKKSTNVAAQAAGISAATKVLEKGVTFVRVVVKGLGPGRLPAIKGLTMGGLQVVSITDDTPVPHNGCRPRKARRT